MEQEINNGGFSQFFYNSSGDLSNEIVDSFTKIGAVKTAKICKNALKIFGGKVPSDREKRGDLLDFLDCDDELEKCDDAFFEYEEALEALNLEYIKKHRKYFD